MAVLARPRIQFVQGRLPKNGPLQHSCGKYLVDRCHVARLRAEFGLRTFALHAPRNFVRGPRSSGTHVRIPRGRSRNFFSTGEGPELVDRLRVYFQFTLPTFLTGDAAAGNAPATLPGFHARYRVERRDGGHRVRHSGKGERGWNMRPRG